jgi:hypothetical protein
MTYEIDFFDITPPPRRREQCLIAMNCAGGRHNLGVGCYWFADYRACFRKRSVLSL